MQQIFEQLALDFQQHFTLMQSLDLSSISTDQVELIKRLLPVVGDTWW